MIKNGLSFSEINFMLCGKQQRHMKEKRANTACTGLLGLCAFLRLGSELWQLSVFEPFSPPAAGNASRWAAEIIIGTEPGNLE